MLTDLREQARQAGERSHHFHGGLRMHHHKQVSCSRAVERPGLPARLLVPLLQHSGPAARCVVSVGERVLKGQLLGEAGPDGGAHVHAPTSGRVEALVQRPCGAPPQRLAPCVVLAADGLDEWAALEPLPAWETAEPAELARRILAAGIVGLGGAVFPTHQKLSSATGVHTLILNGAECEPWIACDEMLMREQPERIVTGARILARTLAVERVLIAIEDQMGAVTQALTEALRRHRDPALSIELVRIPTIYPEGGERQLVQALTGLEVPLGGFPSDLGLLIQNVGTAAAVAEAICTGRPLIERYVTVTGNGLREPRNLLALIGTPIEHLVAACGGYTPTAARLVLGGPMMGYALDCDDEPLIKAANCVLVLEAAEITDPVPEVACIRCGECARVCPARLSPQQLHFFLRSEQWQQAADWNLKACIECACCDLVCPSHIPLAGWFRFGKDEMRRLSVERTAADHARERHVAREKRLAQAEADKAARLAKRKAALQAAATPADPPESSS